MNEVEELSKLELSDLPPLKPILMDDLYQSVLKNLYLELGSGPVLYLISPNGSVLTPTPAEAVSEFITRKEGLLDYLKETIVQNLALYSAIIDVNSYFIEQNDGLVLARLRERDSGGRLFEIKFYTHAPEEVLPRYEDKIYIGRDFLDLYNPVRRYFGVKEYIQSLKLQYDRLLLERIDCRQKKAHGFTPFLQEIGESVNELAAESDSVLEILPPIVDYAKLCGSDLLEVISQYRALNHFLIELHDAVEEFEGHLRAGGHTDFVRYVTKYKKDVTNLISYFNIKIIGVLTRHISQCRNKHS